MNSNMRRKILAPFSAKAALNLKVHLDHEQSQTGQAVQQSDSKYARDILNASEKMESVEDMVTLEQSLQRLDVLKAHSKEDKNSILAAQKNYAQLAATIKMMRMAPDSYFKMNMGHKDTKGDPKKIVGGNSLDYITGNITRMENRKKFAPESEREIWDARITVAKKTGDMFRTLHNNLADNFMRKQKMQAAREAKQQQQQERKGKGRE